MPAEQDWNEPLLITGCPRTGSTALTRGLATHREFCLFNEYHLYIGNAGSCEAWDRVMTMPSTNRPPEKVSPSVDALRYQLRQSFLEEAGNDALRRWLYGTAEPSPNVYGDKLPMSYLHRIEDLAREHPRARYLVTVRDGRDVIASQMRAYYMNVKNGQRVAPWMKETVQKAQVLWLEAMHLWLKHRLSPPVECLEVRYEEAVRSPATLLKRVCDFTGVDYEPDAFAGFFSEYVPTRIGGWRIDCPDMEKHLSREFMYTLEAFGYE